MDVSSPITAQNPARPVAAASARRPPGAAPGLGAARPAAGERVLQGELLERGGPRGSLMQSLDGARRQDHPGFHRRLGEEESLRLQALRAYDEMRTVQRRLDPPRAVVDFFI